MTGSRDHLKHRFALKSVPMFFFFVRRALNMVVFMYKRLRRGALAKLWKATIKFILSVGLSVRVEKVGSHWRDFHEI